MSRGAPPGGSGARAGVRRGVRGGSPGGRAVDYRGHECASVCAGARAAGSGTEKENGRRECAGMNRWWTYQKERFPLLAHGPLIAAFSVSAVSYSALLRRGQPAPESFIVAFV